MKGPLLPGPDDKVRADLAAKALMPAKSTPHFAHDAEMFCLELGRHAEFDGGVDGIEPDEFRRKSLTERSEITSIAGLRENPSSLPPPRVKPFGSVSRFIRNRGTGDRMRSLEPK